MFTMLRRVNTYITSETLLSNMRYDKHFICSHNVLLMFHEIVRPNGKTLFKEPNETTLILRSKINFDTICNDPV